MPHSTSHRTKRPTLRHKLTPVDPDSRRRRAEQRAEQALALYDRRIKVALLLLAGAAALAAILFAAACDAGTTHRAPTLLAVFVALGKGLGPTGAGLLGALLVGAGVFNLDRTVQGGPPEAAE